jgi:hypothetical protein
MTIVKTYPKSFTNQSTGYSASMHASVAFPRKYFSWTDSTSGDENPRYQSQIKEGSNASTNFIGSKTEVLSQSEHDFSCRFGPPWNDTESFKGFVLSPSVTPGTPNFTSADAAALGQFYSSARDAISSMKGMTFLGEIAEVIHMIKHPGESLFKGVGSYLDQLKKTNPRLPLRSRRKILSDTYLEYAFGWAPLVNDIKDAVKALTKLGAKKEFIRVSGHGSSVVQMENSTLPGSMIGSLSPTVESLVTTGESSVRYYGAVKGTASVPRTTAVLNQFGFKLDEFIPTAWELLPWSFLIDYFTNIGDIVSATSFVNAQLAWCSKTTRYEVVRNYNSVFDSKKCALSNPFPIYNGGGDSSSSWSVKYVGVTRLASVSPSVPSFQFSLPGSKTRWANIVALSLQSNTLARLFK